jgi:hypothetical protein
MRLFLSEVTAFWLIAKNNSNPSRHHRPAKQRFGIPHTTRRSADDRPAGGGQSRRSNVVLILNLHFSKLSTSPTLPGCSFQRRDVGLLV